MAKHYFITGTDTEVGKTYIATQLLQSAKAEGLSALGMKPIASGAVHTSDGLRNEDALALQAASSLSCPYEVINPFCFEPAIAPHLAARQVGVELTVKKLLGCYSKLYSYNHDVTVVEGAGGWFVPLNETETMADFVRALGLDVIVVVAMRLGCINHALLTVAAIESAGVRVAGWVANSICPQLMPEYGQNINTLKSMLQIPLIAETKFAENAKLVLNMHSYEQ